MKLIVAIALTLGAAACSAPSARDTDLITDPPALNGLRSDSVKVNGPLRLSVVDFLAAPGFLFALPSITAQTGGIVVENTRYGSLCIFAVTGSADIQGSRVGLHVRYSQRLTSCAAEVRALRYTAEVSLPAGSYDVAVIHEENGAADTLRRAPVVVR